MKATSIRNPWAWAILHAGKDIENRTWNTKTRGTIAVHVSQTMGRPYYEQSVYEIKKLAPRAKVPPYDEMLRGVIIGLVEVVGCEPKTKSKWHGHGLFGFILTNPRSLRQPIPCKGSLGFWEVPADVAKRISRQLK